MAGRFNGLSDLEWKLFEDIFPKQASQRGKGMPHAPYRHVLNSLLYILITGCRWCDLPRGGSRKVYYKPRFHSSPRWRQPAVRQAERGFEIPIPALRAAVRSAGMGG
ncbi:transposase [uncultured Nostoc sp.]|uniref:transposase n=1 Tax=uncultured Nostoc sp. TaxID=340711 RepID=UPI0035CC7EA3